MSDKTLGQVFHEAFIARLHAREPMIGGQIVTFCSWQEASETYQEDTQAAAEAVEAEIRKDIESLLSAEAREVIEAAKAVTGSSESKVFADVPFGLALKLIELRKAVEALQEETKGEEK